MFLSLFYCLACDKDPVPDEDPDIPKNAPVLVDTFDGTFLDPGKWGLSFYPLDDGIYPEIVSSPTRAGSGAIKQTVQYMWNGEPLSNRCEIQAYRQREPRIRQHKGYYQRFDESWTGFSIYFPSASWGADNICKELVYQLHGSADAGEPSKSPPLSLKVELGSTECYWEVRWDENLISNSAQPTGPGAGLEDIWRGPIFGIYKWDWQDGPSDVTERIIYHDEFRDFDGTASYEDVDPAQRDK